MNGGIFKAPADVQITQVALAGVPAERVEGKSTSAGVLVYLHGGGYFACSARTHRPYTTAFAQHGFLVFAPDYRLAPENRFPAAVEDAVAAWRAVRADVVEESPMVIAGDSAGGGLALATMLRLRELGDPMPAAAALFSPFTDLAGAGESRRTNSRRCAMFRGDVFQRALDYYGGTLDPHDPLISPLYAELRGLPPLLIHVGEDETLRDDSTALAEKARAAGVAVQLKLWPAVPHVWQLFHPFVPEGRRSLAEAAGFLAEAIQSARVRARADFG
jgi:acetyl esterase/lipase